MENITLKDIKETLIKINNSKLINIQIFQDRKNNLKESISNSLSQGLSDSQIQYNFISQQNEDIDYSKISRIVQTLRENQKQIKQKYFHMQLQYTYLSSNIVKLDNQHNQLKTKEILLQKKPSPSLFQILQYKQKVYTQTEPIIKDNEQQPYLHIINHQIQEKIQRQKHLDQISELYLQLNLRNQKMKQIYNQQLNNFKEIKQQKEKAQSLKSQLKNAFEKVNDNKEKSQAKILKVKQKVNLAEQIYKTLTDRMKLKIKMYEDYEKQNKSIKKDFYLY